MSQQIEGLDGVEGETSLAWRPDSPAEKESRLPANRPGSVGYPATRRQFGCRRARDRGLPDESHLARPRSPLRALGTMGNSAVVRRFGKPGASSEAVEIAMNEAALTQNAVGPSGNFSDTPDYVKAVCGLAFGVMMTSGSLFPDLVSRLPRRVPKWWVVLRSRLGRTHLAASRRFCAGNRLRLVALAFGLAVNEASLVRRSMDSAALWLNYLA